MAGTATPRPTDISHTVTGSIARSCTARSYAWSSTLDRSRYEPSSQVIWPPCWPAWRKTALERSSSLPAPLRCVGLLQPRQGRTCDAGGHRDVERLDGARAANGDQQVALSANARPEPLALVAQHEDGRTLRRCVVHVDWSVDVGPDHAHAARPQPRK